MRLKPLIVVSTETTIRGPISPVVSAETTIKWNTLAEVWSTEGVVWVTLHAAAEMSWMHESVFQQCFGKQDVSGFSNFPQMKESSSRDMCNMWIERQILAEKKEWNECLRCFTVVLGNATQSDNMFG